MKDLVFRYIRDYVQKGSVFTTQALYARLSRQFPKECEQLGIYSPVPLTPKWTDQIHSGLRGAKKEGLIRDVDVPGCQCWERI
jgi:hypothetical protein